ncbi:hypothetical protein ACFQ60_37565 [Streptomyces zhihengii]
MQDQPGEHRVREGGVLSGAVRPWRSAGSSTPVSTRSPLSASVTEAPSRGCPAADSPAALTPAEPEALSSQYRSRRKA